MHRPWPHCSHTIWSNSGRLYPPCNVLFPLPALSAPLCPPIKTLPIRQDPSVTSSIRVPHLSNRSNSFPLNGQKSHFPSILFIWYLPCLFVVAMCAHICSPCYTEFLDGKAYIMSSILPIFWTQMAQREINPLEFGERTNKAASLVGICWFCIPGIHLPSSSNSIIILHSFLIHAQKTHLESSHVSKV